MAASLVRGFRASTMLRIAAGVLAAATAARADDEKTVLVVYAETRLLPVIALLDQSIRSTLQSRSPKAIHFYTEYLDLSWFADSGPETLIARLLREKYTDANVDLVIACGEEAIRFLLRERADVLPLVPIVFCAADRNILRELALPPNTTGVAMSLDWGKALELVIRLHPQARRVAFIGGTGPTAHGWEREARTAFSKHGDLEFEYLTGLPMADLLKRVAELPEGTVGLFSSFIRDGAGRTFTGPEALALIAGTAKFPIYSISETLIGHGIVGGPMIDWEGNGRSAADLAWRILNGERLGPVDTVDQAGKGFVFDARQLERWGIAESRLPTGSVVRFRPPSLWEQYKWHVVAALVLTVLQTLLIVALLVERRWRKRAEGRLDERLRFEVLLADLSTRFVKISRTDVDRQIEDGLRRVAEELGVDRAALGEFVPGGGQMRITHAWTRDDVPAPPAMIESTGLPWTTMRLRRGEAVFWSRPGDLPQEASVDLGTATRLGIKSVAIVPFVVEGAVAGALACSLLRAERKWPGELVQRLGLLAEIFAVVLLRRRARNALEESEGRFRLMADAAPVMIWVAGTDGGCVDFNKAWLAFTGRTVEEERGDGWVAGVHPDDRERCLHSYREALVVREPFTMDYRLRRFDGVYRSILDSGVPRFGPDGFSGYVGSATDITEMKAAQRALVESIALRSAIFGSLYGEVVALSREGVILAVNESWTRFAAQSGGDPARVAPGTNYLDVCRRAAASGDADAARALEAIEGVIAGKTERALIEYGCGSPSGTQWFTMTVEPFRRPEGGVVISHIDVTRRHRAEEEVENGREELAHALRVATLGELTATLAHEISQPLTAIVSNAQAIRLTLNSGKLERTGLSEALQDIASDAQRASEVIRRLRALFRKDYSGRRPVDVNEAIAEVTSLLKKDLERKHVSLQLHLAPDLPPVLADVVQLQQVFLNVVVNACDAMSGNNGAPRELRIETVRREPGKIAIAICDSGRGVAEADLDHIFDRFLTTKPEGLGMGLAISRSIIDAHGGRIWATRNEAGGLTVHSELPSLRS